MFKATVKNSFLSILGTEEAQCKKRSRSADSYAACLLPKFDDEVVRIQLDRLGTMLNQELPIKPQETCMVQKPQAAAHRRISNCSTESLSKLGVPRVVSNNSVHTMVPDDSSDFDESLNDVSYNFVGLQHRRSVSSDSTCSMTSESESESFTTPVAKAATQGRCPVKNESSLSFTDEFSHRQVPRTVNLAEEFAATVARSGPYTTIMIRNIPNRYTQTQIMKDLEMLGFAGTFDFFYAPMDKRTQCTVGYAFVNFFEPEVAQRCMRVMTNYWFKCHGRQKAKQARVSVAHIQGLEANLKHYENAVVNKTGDGQHGPVIMPRLAKTLSAF